MVRRPTSRRFGRLTPHALALAALAAASALTACGTEFVGPDREGEWASSTGGSGGGPDTTVIGGVAGQPTSRLVGRWWRLVAFTSEGASRTSETFWEFHADGFAERRLVTSNLTHGLSDVLVWTARWRPVGDQIEITYVAPPQGTVRFRWRVERQIQGEVLFLDETRFRRLP